MEEAFRGICVTPLLDEDIEHLPMLIHRSPQGFDNLTGSRRQWSGIQPQSEVRVQVKRRPA